MLWPPSVVSSTVTLSLPPPPLTVSAALIRFALPLKSVSPPSVGQNPASLPTSTVSLPPPVLTVTAPSIDGTATWSKPEPSVNVVRPVWLVTLAGPPSPPVPCVDTGRTLVSTVSLLLPLPSETVTEASPE